MQQPQLNTSHCVGAESVTAEETVHFCSLINIENSPAQRMGNHVMAGERTRLRGWKAKQYDGGAHSKR